VLSVTTFYTFVWPRAPACEVSRPAGRFFRPTLSSAEVVDVSAVRNVRPANGRAGEDAVQQTLTEDTAEAKSDHDLSPPIFRCTQC
jgi:hypothetical protein